MQVLAFDFGQTHLSGEPHAGAARLPREVGFLREGEEAPGDVAERRLRLEAEAHGAWREPCRVFLLPLWIENIIGSTCKRFVFTRRSFI